MGDNRRFPRKLREKRTVGEYGRNGRQSQAEFGGNVGGILAETIGRNRRKL